MGTTAPAVVRAAALCLLVACWSPPKPACGFKCGPDGACPASYSCSAGDGHCHLNGSSPSIVCPLLDASIDAFDFSPFIVEVIPNSDATAVRLDINPSARFSEQVFEVTEASFYLTVDADGTPVPADSTYDTSSRTASIHPYALLATNTVYRVTVGDQIVDDENNQVSGPRSWTFKTQFDTTAPIVTAVSPPTGSTGVPLDTILVATFSEQVSHVTVSSFLLQDAAPVAGAIGYVSQVAVKLTPSALLQPNTVYTAMLTNEITDLVGNPLANAPYIWTFTTGADTFAPKLVARVPEADDTDIAITTTVTARFDESVTGVSGTTMTLDQAGTPVAATVTYTDATHTAKLAPDAALAPNTTYTAKLTNGIADAAGNPLAPAMWMFTTAP